MSAEKQYYSTKETAEYLGVTVGTLAVWRCNKSQSIDYHKVGSRVMYDKRDLDAWLKTNRVEVSFNVM